MNSRAYTYRCDNAEARAAIERAFFAATDVLKASGADMPATDMLLSLAALVIAAVCARQHVDPITVAHAVGVAALETVRMNAEGANA